MPFMLQSPPYRLKEYKWSNPPLTIPEDYKLFDSQKSLEEYSLTDIIDSYRHFYFNIISE